jgi:DNA invertase Pin-like site-specific DNA recombinase
MKLVVGYVRVSTGRQAREGISLESQDARIRQWAGLQEAQEIVVESDAGRSGGRVDNRPGLRRAVDLACREGAVLVVHSLSRLARSTRDAIELMQELNEAGADFVSLSESIDTTTAAGKLIFTMIAAFAEFERGMICERAKETADWLRSKGLRTGEVPFGWDADEDNRLVRYEPEQQLLVMMSSMRGRGVSLANIAGILNEHGIPTKKGGRWHGKTVQRILARLAA